MRRFSFHKRGEIFYCQLWNAETGRFMSARSTGARDKEEALLVAARWLSEGVPTGRTRAPRPAPEAMRRDAILSAIRSESFSADDAAAVLDALRGRGFLEGFTLKGTPAAEKAIDFLRRFWDEDESPYISKERKRGRSITRRHTREMARIIERYWAEPLGDLPLGELTCQVIQANIDKLADHGLAAATIAKALAALATATKLAAAKRIIPENPAQGVERVIGKAKARGILDDEELAALATSPELWKDERARVAFLVAATTGLRRGEVIALRLEDVGTDRLMVRHAWNDDDRLKAPKNGEAREAALLPEVRKAMLDLAAGNPHKLGAEGFIFYGPEPDRPIDGKIISRGFDDALTALELGDGAAAASETERAAAFRAVKARGLTFHSLRHGFAKRMAERLDTERAMKATGHLSAAMLEHYADHRTAADFEKVAAAAADAFKVIPFSRSASA